MSVPPQLGFLWLFVLLVGEKFNLLCWALKSDTEYCSGSSGLCVSVEWTIITEQSYSMSALMHSPGLGLLALVACLSKPKKNLD